MPIKLTCTKCGKALRLKDELAGRKVACPGCKTVLRAPAAAAVGSGDNSGGPVDHEALALQAIAEQIAAEQPPEPQYVEFTCPQCDEVVSIGTELAGKQAPCPACRRIVKVPALQKTGPRDWRQTAPKAGPDAALLKNQEVLEDSWSSAATSKVSGEALFKAGAIKIQKPKLTRVQWAQRIVGGLAALALLAVGWWLVSGLLRGNTQASLLARVDGALAGDVALPEDARFEINRLLGRYIFQVAQRPDLKLDRDGTKYLAAARQQLGQTTDPLDRYIRAAELLQDYREFWPTAETLPNELAGVLVLAPSGLPRWRLFRSEVRHRLATAGENAEGQAQALQFLQLLLIKTIPPQAGLGAAGRDYSDEVGALGVLGQECLRVKRRDLAKQFFEQGRPKSRSLPHEPLPFLVLRSMLEEPFPDKVRDADAQSAQVLAAARRGKRAEMQERLAKLRTLNSLGEAEVRIELAEELLDEAKDLAQSQLLAIREIVEPRSPEETQFARWELCRLALRIEGPEIAEPLAAKLLPPAAQARIRLLIFERKLATSGENLPVAAVEEVQPHGTATGLAYFTLARFLQPRDSGAAARLLGEIKRPADGPFIHLGMLQGMADGGK